MGVLVKQPFYTKWVILLVSELGKFLINFVQFLFKLYSEKLLFNYIFRNFKSYVPLSKNIKVEDESLYYFFHENYV